MHHNHALCRVFTFALIGWVWCPWGCDGLGADGAQDTETPKPVAANHWQEAFQPGEDGALLCVWGPRSDDVWSVGGQPDLGVAWHFDGEAWSPFDIPRGPLINWVHGHGNTLFMVGNEGRILRRIGDGPFETMESGTERPLWGVWAASRDRVWAVGGDPLSAEASPIILTFDGEAWRESAQWAVDRNFRAFFKVWGTAEDNVLVVGSDGVVLIYDGTQWTQIPTGTSRDLISLWGTGPTEVVAVGGRRNGTIGRWDGVEWTTEVLPGEPGLNGVWVDRDGTAWLAGERGRILQLSPGTFEATREINSDGTLLHGIFGIDDARWAVGGTLDANPPWRGIALETRP